MSRYVLTKKRKKIFEAQGHELICKICTCPILVGDVVESKQQRRGKVKLYHAKCYDDSFIDIPDDGMTDDEVERFFKIPKVIITHEPIVMWIVRSYGKKK